MAGERQRPGHRGLVNPEEMMMASPKWLCVTEDQGTTGGRGGGRGRCPKHRGDLASDRGRWLVLRDQR